MLANVLAAAGALSLALAAPDEVLPAEMFPLVVRWEALDDLPVVRSGEDGALSEQTWLEIADADGSVRAYREGSARPSEGTAPSKWPRGTRVTQQVLIAYARSSKREPNTYALPAAGNYRLRLHYDDEKYNVHATSPWVSIRVIDPIGTADIGALEGIRRNVKLGELVRAYPTSRYVAYQRLYSLNARARRIDERHDPMDETPVLLEGEQLQRWRMQKCAELASALEAEAGAPGLFAREALVRVLALAWRMGDRARIAALEARLQQEYPGWTDVPWLPLP